MGRATPSTMRSGPGTPGAGRRDGGRARGGVTSTRTRVPGRPAGACPPHCTLGGASSSPVQQRGGQVGGARGALAPTPSSSVFVDGRPQHAVKQGAGPGADGSLDARRAAYGWLASEARVSPASRPGRWSSGAGRPGDCSVWTASERHMRLMSMQPRSTASSPLSLAHSARVQSVSTTSSRAREACPRGDPGCSSSDRPAPRHSWLRTQERMPPVSAALCDSAVVALLKGEAGVAARCRDPPRGEMGQRARPPRPRRRRAAPDRLGARRLGQPLWDLAAVLEGLVTTSFFLNRARGVAGVGGPPRLAVAAYGTAPTSRERLFQLVAARLSPGHGPARPDDRLTRSNGPSPAGRVAGERSQKCIRRRNCTRAGEGP